MLLGSPTGSLGKPILRHSLSAKNRKETKTILPCMHIISVGSLYILNFSTYIFNNFSEPSVVIFFIQRLDPLGSLDIVFRSFRCIIQLSVKRRKNENRNAKWALHPCSTGKNVRQNVIHLLILVYYFYYFYII